MTTNHQQMTNGNVSSMTNRLTFPDDTFQQSEGKITQTRDTLLARMRPTLVIGLGGTGQQEVVHLKALLTGRFGQAWRRKVRLLVFDTTEEPIAVPLNDALIQLEAGSEFFNISQVPVGSILRNLDKLDAIRERLGSTMHRLPATSLRNGAKQIRPLGLLALLWHHKKVWEQLRKAIWSLAGRDVSEAHTAIQEAGINVFILCSLAGGTGSGTFLDVAYLIRVLFAELGDQNHSGHITGIAALPQAFYGLEGPNLLANTGAALEEINHAMIYGGFSTLYPDGRRVNLPDSPFDLLYVVDGVDEKGKTWTGGIHQVAQMVAQGVFLQMASQVGRKGENAFDNVDHVLSGQSDDGFGTFLASLGLGYLVFPAQAVIDVCSRWLFLQLAREQWLRSADDKTSGQTAASRLYVVTEHQLTPELRRDPQSGAELRVDLRQPSWLAEIASDQISAAATRFVQDYGQARLNEMLLGQLEQNSRQAAEKASRDWTSWVAETLFSPDTSLNALQVILRQARQQLGSWMSDRRRQIGEQEQAFERSQTALTQRQMALAEAADSLFLGRGKRVREALDRYFQTAQATYQRQASLAESRGLIRVWMTLDGTLDRLIRQVQHLTERIAALQTEIESSLPQQVQALAKAGVSRHSLAGEAYVRQLWGQYAPKQVNLADLLAMSMPFEGEKPGLLLLTDLSPAELRQSILTGLQQPFRPLLSLSVEQVIADQADRLSPTARREQLFQLATPSWNVERVRLPEGGASLERLQVLGVPDSSQTHYADEPMLVDTHNPRELVALVVVAGAPPSALVQHDAYQREMEKAVAPLYVLPHFLAADNQAPLAFALGSIFGLVVREGSHFYYQPSDPLEKPLRLGQGLENAIRGVAEQERLTREIMERIDSQIARLGSQRSIKKLTAYYTAVPEGRTQVDETMRELKRLVRDYAAELQRLNDFSQDLDQI